MSKTTPISTREYLEQIPLPTWATSYTVISYETVIVNVLAQLKLKGFSIETEKYRATNNGQIAVGMYQLKYENDPELGMMFAWANSYNKAMRFKCSVGGFVRVSGSAIINADFSWGRKHTGTADQEMVSQVADQIANAQIYYKDLLQVKDAMKKTQLNRQIISEFLGRAFFQRNLFSKEQISIVRDELQKPSFDYNADKDSLWTCYNHMLVALKKAHPRTWLDEQRELHKYICKEFNLVTPPVVVTTTTNHSGPPTVVQVTPSPGPVQVYEIVSKAVEKELNKTLQEIGTNTESYPPALPKKELQGVNLEEHAEQLMDKVVEENKEALDKSFTEELTTGKSQFHVTITKPDETPLSEMKPDNSVPFLEDITPEEQKLIDERLAMLTGTKTETITNDLNLPD